MAFRHPPTGVATASSSRSATTDTGELHAIVAGWALTVSATCSWKELRSRPTGRRQSGGTTSRFRWRLLLLRWSLGQPHRLRLRLELTSLLLRVGSTSAHV